jgi:hypothetical protein
VQTEFAACQHIQLAASAPAGVVDHPESRNLTAWFDWLNRAQPDSQRSSG